jgi:hypothetical protein
MATFTPKYDRKKVLTGPAQLWIQELDLDAPPELPEVTTALGADWPSPWAVIGATREGVTVRFAREATDIRIEEQSTPVDQKTTSAGFTFTAQLSEDSLETMRIAYGGGEITTTAPTTTDPGYQTLVINDEVGHFAIGLESFGPPRTGVPVPWRRVLVGDVTSVAEVETPYRRADQQRVYPVTFSSLEPISDTVITEQNAPITP